MQQDVYSQRYGGETHTQPGRTTEGMTEGIQPTGYLPDTFGAMGDWMGQIGSFFSHRPVFAGSLFVAIVGAIAGIRIAQMQAMRRRRSLFEKAMDRLGYAGDFVADWFSRTPAGPMDTIRDRGRDIVGATRDAGVSMIDTMPIVGRPHMEIGKGPESTAKQVGYALSLIPITMALIRNPLVRDVGFRYLSRRITRR